MDKKIYFDNNATTKCDKEVLKAMLTYIEEEYGNPSSIYSFGKNVKDSIELSVKQLSFLLSRCTLSISISVSIFAVYPLSPPVNSMCQETKVQKIYENFSQSGSS